MSLTSLLFVAAVASFTALAAICDLRTKKLPNGLTVPAFAAALMFHTALGGWSGLAGSLAGFATGFGILLVLWLIGGGGAGDVKLMGALGAWLGVKLTLAVFVLSAAFVLLGCFAVVLGQFLTRGALYVRRRYLVRPSERAAKRNRKQTQITAEARQRQRLLPYAVPVALGTWVVLTWNVISLVG